MTQYCQSLEAGCVASTESELRDEAEAEARGKRGRSRSMSVDHFSKIQKGSILYERGFRDERPPDDEVPGDSIVKTYFDEFGHSSYRVEKRDPREQERALRAQKKELQQELKFQTGFNKGAAETKADLERRAEITAECKRDREAKAAYSLKIAKEIESSSRSFATQAASALKLAEEIEETRIIHERRMKAQAAHAKRTADAHSPFDNFDSPSQPRAADWQYEDWSSGWKPGWVDYSSTDRKSSDAAVDRFVMGYSGETDAYRAKLRMSSTTTEEIAEIVREAVNASRQEVQTKLRETG
jgi:hypothetical protein